MQLLDATQPRGLTGTSKAIKKGPLSCLLNKIWKFGSQKNKIIIDVWFNATF